MGVSGRGSVFCISFDGVPVSGIVEECVKLATVFHKRGLNVYLDLGYDIFSESAFFGRNTTDEERLPRWIRRVNVQATEHVHGYTQDFVDDLLHKFVARNGRGGDELRRRALQMAEELTDRLLRLWARLDVRYVVVENGTLPENLVYTDALRRAVHLYGKQKGLERYVIWRDHDLMWFCQRGRFGTDPFPAVTPPRSSPYVVHVVTNDLARQRFARWAGHDAEVLPSYHRFIDRQRHAPREWPLRRQFGIPLDACLIARCSRVIYEKRIDREIRAIAELRRMAAEVGDARDFYLFVTGPTNESPGTKDALQQLAEELDVGRFVVWGDGLSGFGNYGEEARAASGKFSVRDLLFEANLSSFLTSFGYEGYGLPPGEAIATNVPFTSSTYEMYDTIYGVNQYQAPLYPITEADDAWPGPDYYALLFDFLMDERKQTAHAEFNFHLGRKLFSLEAMEARVEGLLPSLRRLPHIDDTALSG
jgi:glycosyltransferase involved in cell wall biosynthesis